ncbi:MAG TPA: RsmE family RNA methyltransferase [Opitutaceae bacterium]|nr:RsmE family RNA methyltransferase [Opitutaceae bacterium]
MNLLLFARDELGRALPAADPRARHLRSVLRRGVGEEFDLGVIDGPRGKGRVTALPADGAVEFAATLGDEPPLLPPLHLVIGLPRPQTARKILQECTALGVGALHFVGTGRADPNYAQSTLWSSGEWSEHLVDGAQQAFCTRLPVVTSGRPLATTLDALPADALRLALDNYEASAGLADIALPSPTPAAAVLALGPERGWADSDRAALRAAGFALVHLGPRVLRVETACVAAVAILKARLGWL